jgi:hypothetical protein
VQEAGDLGVHVLPLFVAEVGQLAGARGGVVDYAEHSWTFHKVSVLSRLICTAGWPSGLNMIGMVVSPVMSVPRLTGCRAT